MRIGSTVVNVTDPGRAIEHPDFVVLTDPDGNEFCDIDKSPRPGD